MVGVAGRSKACKTCKQRKIACSLEKPICKVCIKSNRECGGYQRERVFILDARTQKDASKTPPKVCAPTSPNKHVSPSNEKARPPPEELHGTISLKNAYNSLWTLQCPTTRAIYREQIISEFIYSFLPGSGSGNWLSLLPCHPTFTSALEASSLAVCTAHLGHVNASPTLIHESLKFYIQALWELQRALWNEALMYRDETLAACMLLIIYEVTECPDKTIGAWQGHMAGCSKLFQTRGPDSFDGEFGHKLFSSFRQLEIQQAIVEKRETFLSSPAWREKPWKSRPKPISQQLLDVESELATSIAAVYAAPPSESPEDFLVVLLETLKQSWAVDAQLSAFYKNFQAQKAGSVYSSTPSQGFNHTIKTSSSTEDVIFPMCFQFPDLTTAHTCMIYWALTSILWSGMSKIYTILTDMQTQAQVLGSTNIALFEQRMSKQTATSPMTSPTTTPETETETASSDLPTSTPLPASSLDLSLSPFSSLPSLEHRINPTIPAKNICQSLEYCMTSSQGTIAATAAIFPLKVAIETLCEANCEREMEWAKGVFGVIGGAKGVEILKHLGEDVEKKAYLPG